MADFSGKTVLVTGAGGEIGMAVARRFAQAGANLVLTDLDPSTIAEVKAEPSARIIALRQDVTRLDDAMDVAAKGAAAFGGFDVVVTSAGLYQHAPFGAMRTETWDAGISVNLDGVFLTLKALHPHLRSPGSIVNVASMAAHRGSFEHSQYAAAKGGVLALTRSLARELAPGIRVNAVSPGLIDTRMIRQLADDQLSRLVSDTPLHRLGTADEVAQAVLFLSSPAASFITGEVLHVNGGLHMAG
jgi:3-oxoacyl-[acyl-carrier protein] reductase